MSNYKLVPLEPTAEMVEAAEDIYMPSGDMDLAIRAALLTAPAVQGEPVGWVWHSYNQTNFTSGSHHKEVLEADGVKLTPVYTTPQPAEQKPLEPSLAFDASVHLTNWLNMNLCECEGGHSCGYNEVKRTRDALLLPAEQKPAPDVAKLVEALEEGLRAIGDHHAPGDCYATGPMTGDPFRDLVQCPACSFIAMCDDLLAAYRKGGCK